MRRRALILPLAPVLLAACASSPAPGGLGECLRPDPGTELPRGATLAGEAGAYRLTLVATSGPESGDRDQGSLLLVSRDDPTNPLIGWSSANPEAVGAYPIGGLDSHDPERPGIRVLEAESGIVLRLGADANVTGEMRFDGAYTALRVREITEDGFRGTWESGIDRIDASGYFCARRVEQTG